MQQDAQFWRSLVLGQLKILLDHSPSYSPERKQACLELMNTHVIGALGPSPTSSQASWKSYLTDDHSPVEYSLSIQKGACIVRLAIEPLSSESGTSADPVNYFAPHRWISSLRNSEGRDMEWFNKLSRKLSVCPMPDVAIRSEATGITQYAYGLDLTPDPMIKAYILHDALARQISSSPSEWGRQKHVALTDALTLIGLESPWKKVLTYLDALSQTNPECAGQAEFVAWDVVDPDKARVKVYVRFSNADLPRLLSHLDLGGKLKRTKHVEEIRSAATELWNIFAGDDEDSSLLTGIIDDDSARTRGVILYYELKLGSDEPVAKFYFPIRHYFSSDLVIATRFDSFLASKEIAAPGWYMSLLQSYSSHRPLDTRPGLQTLLGCAVRGGEWELSMYFSAEAYAPERWYRGRS